MRILSLTLLVAFAAQAARAVTVFEDGFEAGSLRPEWFAATTLDGRVTVTPDFSPAAGDRHLVLDDAINDANHSIAEAILTVDLADKKNVVLHFQAKSLGNEPHEPPAGPFTTARAHDAVAISADGGKTWLAVQSLASLPVDWQACTIPLDQSVASLGGKYTTQFKIRFSQYDNSPAPMDGIAIDNVRITAAADQRSLVELASPLSEGTGPQVGHVVLSYPPAAPLALSLLASQEGQLVLPATVTVPAGETSVSFEFSAADNNVVDLTRTIYVVALAPEVVASPGMVAIYDDEAPVPALTLPAELAEGTMPYNNARLSIDRPATVPLTMRLGGAGLAGELAIPPSVTIPAGQTQVVFSVSAYDDTRIDGTVALTVTATAAGIASASAQTTTIDNESRTLAVELPATLQEGSSASAVVKMSGTLPEPLTVNLSASDTAHVGLPPTVIIPAGATSATFPLTAKENSLVDGTRPVAINVAAPSFASGSRQLLIRDNEVVSYRFDGLGDIVNVSSPVNITVSAADVEGNAISGFTGEVDLTVLMPGGSVQSAIPGRITLAGANGWKGAVTLPSLATAPLRLRAASPERSGTSQALDVMRVLPLATADLVWDATRSRIMASVPATAGVTYANELVAIDPATMQITARVPITEDPGQLALTSAGEALYVVRNRDGVIAKVDPSTMSVTSTFAIGTQQYYGTLYAADICTLPGQPRSLVVSQKDSSSNHRGTAVYDDGVARPVKATDTLYSNRLEASADPSVVFALDTQTSDSRLRSLRIDANGVSLLSSASRLITTDFRTEGNTIYSEQGIVVDGTALKRLGAFQTWGLVAPDRASGRVFFLERKDAWTLFDRISAFDPSSFTLMRRINLPAVVNGASSFIRWGTDGLAFRTASSVIIINSRQLVPTEPPADLTITANVAAKTAIAGTPVTYTFRVVNNGPNVAGDTSVTAVLSDGQSFASTSGAAANKTSDTSIVFALGTLAPGSSHTFSITTSAQSAGQVSCAAAVNSAAIDPDMSSNRVETTVGVAFQFTARDVFNAVRLNANNLIYDSARRVLWATVPSTPDRPGSVVAVNPENGLMSDPLPLGGNPVANSIALSKNARYLYVGLLDASEVHRIDLNSPSYASLRIPLGSIGSEVNYAKDIEVLEGDGTSFIVADSANHNAAVFDGATRRINRSTYYVGRLEKTGSPDVFIGYNNWTSYNDVTRLRVTAAGVSVITSATNLLSYIDTEIKGDGEWILSSTGRLIDSTGLSFKLDLKNSGTPCLDLPNRRAYLLGNDVSYGAVLRGYDLTSGELTGSISVPYLYAGLPPACVRWGADGFAVLTPDKRVLILRWSQAIPPHVDQNGDRIADAWAAKYFGKLDIAPGADQDADGVPNALEYLFGTSPIDPNAASALQPGVSAGSNPPMLHLLFARRAGVPAQAYTYETTSDLAQWKVPQGVTETVVSTTSGSDGPLEWVDAAIPSPAADRGFVRLKWLEQ